MVDIEPRSVQWANNPEPSLPTLDPQVILDANIDKQAWLYDYSNESEAFLVYHGEPAEIVE